MITGAAGEVAIAVTVDGATAAGEVAVAVTVDGATVAGLVVAGAPVYVG